MEQNENEYYVNELWHFHYPEGSILFLRKKIESGEGRRHHTGYAALRRTLTFQNHNKKQSFGFMGLIFGKFWSMVYSDFLNLRRP